MVEQFIDSRLSRSKFAAEIADFRALESEYRARGWLLLSAEFPKALVALAAPKLQPPAVVTGVAFDFSNYDAEPPSVQLVNPFTGQPYRGKELPTLLHRGVAGPQQEFPGLPAGARFQLMAAQPLMQFHDPEDVPFLCISGVREYHEHPGHSGDSWELHRAAGAGRLVRLLDVIYRYGVQPIAGYNVNLIPQISFQVPQPPP